MTEERDWEQAISAPVAAEGRLDVLVNSAGISLGRPVAEMSLADWRRVMAVNLDGAFLGTKHAIRAMRAAGGSAYSASKAALCMLSRAAAKEYAEAGVRVRVNTVCPGGVKTPLWRTMPFFQDLIAKTGSEEAAFAALAAAPGGAPFANPEEVAHAVLYLASDESRHVTGADLVIDGGYSA